MQGFDGSMFFSSKLLKRVIGEQGFFAFRFQLRRKTLRAREIHRKALRHWPWKAKEKVREFGGFNSGRIVNVYIEA